MADLSAVPDDELQAIVSGSHPIQKWSDDELLRIAKGAKQPTPGERGLDMAKGFGVGLGEGGIGLAGMPGDVQQLFQKAGSYMAGRPFETPPGQKFPGSEDVKKRVEELTGPFYEPTTNEGRFARAAGNYAPGALLPSRAGPINRALTQVAAPAAGSEAARALAPDNPYAPVIGGAVGLLAPGAAMRAFTPNPIPAGRQAAVDILHGEGVNPTAGQVTGSKALRYAESSLGDAPLAGGRATAAEQRIGGEFTRAASRRIGENAPRLTPEVMAQAEQRIGNNFNQLSARNNVAVDRQLAQDIGNTQQEYHFVANPLQRQVLDQAVNDIVGVIQQNNGIIPGRQYQAMRSRLGQAARTSQGSDPQLSRAYYGVQHAIDDAMERSIAATGNQADIALWGEARNQYRNFLPLERAMTGAGENTASGLLSPAQLRQATVSAHGRRNYATGQGDFADLARAGNEVLLPMPQSGTTPRAVAMALPTALGAGIGHLLAPGGEGAATGGMVGAMASTAAPSAVGRALMSNPGQWWLRNQALAPALNALDTPRAALIQALMAEPRIQIEMNRSR